MEETSLLRCEYQDSISSLFFTIVVTLSKIPNVSGLKLSSVKCVQRYVQLVTACPGNLVK